MKYLILLLLLSSCSKYPERNVGMVHDYIITQANDLCKSHSGLHYIVSVQDIYSKGGENHEYPCDEVFKVRCQDSVILEIHDGIAYCIIPKMQLDETLKGQK